MANYDFNGKVALVTGACGGIGKATAAQLLANGASVVLADINAQALEKCRLDLGSLGRSTCITYDAAKPEDADRAIETCSTVFGGLDFLIPAAGIYRDMPIADMSDDQWRETIGVNLDGIFYICRRAIPVLRSGGAVVNITSIAAHMGGSMGHGHYGAAKGGVLTFTRSLARELGPNIRANAVSPGVIETAMVQDMVDVRGAEILKQTPLQRFGQAHEIASVVAFLCSDASGFITGEAIHVNGGFYMGG
ncbi:SDR family NAD(P)-dependent oxidoreductase [Pacificibacter marinus]|uniref:SDR family NAD(P)-dependent oxidoreductase n=1 Tax=Pacificibacter marinus TaxID=658057 RepID=UPI001C06CC18|nr:SDR family NAD(P)-dependent oxidoreductase [Pacificibacter marinus]MBU2867796.1 SDR family oxidoreductase [Pacificibacter marinus]